MQGNILIAMKRNPMRDLMRAVEISPYRAEPFMSMAKHHFQMSDACNVRGWQDSACYLRHRVAALHYAKRASKMPQPRKVNLWQIRHESASSIVSHSLQSPNESLSTLSPVP